MASGAVVHLVDDDEGIRQSLAFLLTTAGFAVRVYESGTKFLEAMHTLQPGCIVTDVQMPDLDGLELQRRLRVLGIQLPVILMTGHGDVPLAVEAMKAGAVDFIEKPFDEDLLLNAIRAALERFDALERQTAEVAHIRARLDLLSPREREVLEGLVSGHPNKVIAHELKLSPRTVEVHRANVMAKMGAGSLPDLIRTVLLADGRQPR